MGAGALWQRLDGTARAMSPFSITLLLVVAGLLPLRAPEVAPVMPALSLAAVYYWSVFRPDLMPAWAVLLLGLIQDFLTGVPLGAGALGLVAAHFAVLSLRRAFVHASFFLLWLIFLLLATGALTLVWLAAGLLQGSLSEPRVLLLEWLATIAVYPCLAWLFGRAQQAFLK